ncbi:MAG: single-stranded-DNA-specific exonuclease RecJ [Candidatus Magasanikbacteria bacterium]|nr:single-stranded-DNA-specific exonuclease RecJ [Candidatus Magasanikbacteria bacterium]
MQKIWTLLPEPPRVFLEEHPELPRPVAALLYNRGLQTQSQIDEFLNPDYSQDVHDPFLFQDMRKTVERIFQAFEQKEHITIHGDYDADGVSGSVILHQIFKALGHERFDVFLPHRESDGYGLNMNTIELLHKQGTTLIITCDCGISNKPEIERARELGMDVIVTDHHSIPVELPPAFAIIHPKIPGEPYPDKNLAGGAVAFKLMQALLKHHAESHENLSDGQSHEGFEKWQLDMVALSSVADMVPLIGESRTLTKYGLIVMNKAKRVGMRKLLEEIGLMEGDGKIKREIDAHTIGFHIAPRINAAGRVNHANVGYKLFVAEKATDAVDLAFELEQNNNERREMTELFVKEAIEQVKKMDSEKSPVLFVLGKEWSSGVVGLIASRIKERYEKPTIAMTYNKGELMGSGRSIEEFNMIKALQSMPELFGKFGGHPMACGFTLVDPNKLDIFKKRLTALSTEETKNTDKGPRLDIDAKISLEEVTWEFYDILKDFKPFGMGNPEPKYLAEGLTVHRLEPIGKDSKHLRILVKHNSQVIRKTIGWHLCNENAGDGKDWSKELKPGEKIDMVFEVGINEWNGNRELQLTIVDLRKTG